ncbi:MAG TPA: HAMP domain-containing sensor histidine kinase [Kineosporiaceae bacterium]
MRRQLTLLVGATTSAVVLAFLIPLALVSRVRAEDLAVTAATSQTLSAVNAAVSTRDVKDIPGLVARFVGTTRFGRTTVYLGNGAVIGPDPADAQIKQAMRNGDSGTYPIDDGAAVITTSTGPAGTIAARTIVPRDILHQGVAQTTASLAALGMVLLLGAMFAADRLGRRISAPVRRLAGAAETMRDGNLDVRIPERGTSEVVALAAALNQLAARVQKQMAESRDSVADLSHRLRTPVTALRLDTDSVADPEVAERLRQHVTQLERTVDAIVHDARRPTRAGGDSCDVGKVVKERADFWSALAEEQGRQMRISVPPDRALRARLDASDLSDVVDVLIDNVFAHTEEGVPLEVWVAPRPNGAVVLTVEDGGQGLPQADIIARGSSGAGSTGLGMDIVRRAANASGGTMEVGRSRLGGALIRVVFGPPER